MRLRRRHIQLNRGGVTRQEIVEILLQCRVYAGVSAFMTAVTAAKKTFEAAEGAGVKRLCLATKCILSIAPLSSQRLRIFTLSTVDFSRLKAYYICTNASGDTCDESDTSVERFLNYQLVRKHFHGCA